MSGGAYDFSIYEADLVYGDGSKKSATITVKGLLGGEGEALKRQLLEVVKRQLPNEDIVRVENPNDITVDLIKMAW